MFKSLFLTFFLLKSAEENKREQLLITVCFLACWPLLIFLPVGYLRTSRKGYPTFQNKTKQKPKQKIEFSAKLHCTIHKVYQISAYKQNFFCLYLKAYALLRNNAQNCSRKIRPAHCFCLHWNFITNRNRFLHFSYCQMTLKFSSQFVSQTEYKYSGV